MNPFQPSPLQLPAESTEQQAEEKSSPSQMEQEGAPALLPLQHPASPDAHVHVIPAISVGRGGNDTVGDGPGGEPMYRPLGVRTEGQLWRE